jgi:hypothetical protein
MNAMTGGLVGALVTGLAVVGWQSRPDATPGLAAQSATSAAQIWSRPRAPGPDLVSNAQAFGASSSSLAPAAAGSPVSVRCEPGQRVVLRQAIAANGQAATEAGCVTEAAGFAAVGSEPGVIDPSMVRPATYVSHARVEPERVVYRERTARRSTPRRTWQKRALVIGGSAGAGAGIGALAGGKKGALIGAAVGGGAGTVYELLRK